MTASRGWFVVVNPAAGGGLGLRRWRRLERALRRERVGYEAVVTEAPGQAEALAAAAARAGFRRLLAGGGDGTLNEVVNGAFAEIPAAGGALAFAVAPLGSGNDWARETGLALGPAALARAIAGGRCAPADLGRLEFATDRPRQRYFVNVAGAGIDAHLLARLPPGPLRRIAYLWGVVRALSTYQPPWFEVCADGRRESGRRLLALAGNGSRCGGGMRLAAAARPDDGLLDLVSIEPLSLVEALPRLVRLFDGRLGEERWARLDRAATIELRATPPAPVEADGQLLGHTPVRITLLPGAIRVLRG